ncbi:MAG TPA: hypothetical protein EYN67_12325 [Flavobacteriales bacterium]|nr:hypothetical protein [Flavobacteriales bacterium]
MIKDYTLKLSTSTVAINKIKEIVSANPSQDYTLTVVEKSKDRSINANNQQHLWYGQIAKHYGDRTALEVKNFCKDAIGLPLLLNSSKHGDKLEFLLCKLNYYRHSHESKMKLVQCLEVTSLFNTAESKQYMEQMIFYWSDNGVNIKFKEK